MEAGENPMTAHMPVRSQPPARVRPASDSWARIDPIVYATAARRRQAHAQAEALRAGWRGVRRALSELRAWTRRHITQPLARRSERQQAIAQLSALDARLLADIGLRRSDIELAVDGMLADPRLARRTQAPTPVLTEDRFATQHRDGSAVAAGGTRAAPMDQPDQILDRAA
jgi:uncharacterized protein YjiS (DUF1127 family)